MKLLVRPSLLRGEIAVTGSKSHTTAACGGAGRERHKRARRAARVGRHALDPRGRQALGAKVREHDDVWEITGTGGVFTDPGRTLDLGNSGTGMRMLTGLCAKQSFPIRSMATRACLDPADGRTFSMRSLRSDAGSNRPTANVRSRSKGRSPAGDPGGRHDVAVSDFAAFSAADAGAGFDG